MNSVNTSDELTESTADDQFCIATNVHGRYCIPKRFSARPIPKLLLSGGVWEEETVEFLRHNVGTGDVVHAGAFFGDMLPALSCACQGIVWAFEPNPLNHPSAVNTVELNQLPNVRLFAAGLGAKKGEAMLQIEDAAGRIHLGTSSMVPSRVAASKRNHLAQVLALDDVIGLDRDVCLIHLDVEGYEIEVLKGAVHLLRRCRPLLVLETVPNGSWFVQQVLRDLGYQAVRRVDGNTVFEAGMTAPPPSKRGIRMFHSSKHNVGIFVCHKCGSGSVLRWLHMLEDGLSLADCRNIKAFHATSERRFEVDAAAHRQAHRVAVVRNPYHRLVSCYFDKIANPKNRWLFARREATLEDFVSWLEQSDHLDNQSHWRPQSRQIGEYDTLIRLEEWNSGLVALEQRLNLPHFDEAFINTKETIRLYSGDWRAFLSPSLAKRIQLLYEEDFTRFGYSSHYALAE